MPSSSPRPPISRRWLSAAAVVVLGITSSVAPAQQVAVWQPVTTYSISFPGDRKDAAPAINPFDNFTHLGTDFGWMGPGQDRLESREGAIRTREGTEWTGAWHSLAGLAVEQDRLMDLTDVLGLGGPPEKRAGVTAVVVSARGRGELRVELSDAAKQVRWSRTMALEPGDRAVYRFEVPAAELGRLKFINWVAEPGSAVEVSSLGFEVARPDGMGDEEWLARVSLGKLRRSHDPIGGLTRDRAHLPAGVFDSITSTGLHALASATGAAEGWLDREMVVQELRTTVTTLMRLPRAAGFLPHFTSRQADGQPQIHPGTEYSTVDTAITLISLRLAAVVLDLPDVLAATTTLLEELNFELATCREGWICHGFATDGTTPLASQWRDWGGETALVLILEGMVPGRTPRGKMDAGEVFRDVQFISEIQSLFFPDFDRDTPDRLTGTVWPERRAQLLERQIRYVAEQWPDSAAARAGIFGRSAGEAGMPGDGYEAYGIGRPGLRWLHPHAMVMGLALSGRTRYPDGIRHLTEVGLLFPQGLPETVEIDLLRHNPMQGSLNAGFEAISAYHGWRRGQSDVIDDACRRDPLLRAGVRRFYDE